MAVESVVLTGASESPTGSAGSDKSTVAGGGSIVVVSAGAGVAPIEAVTCRLGGRGAGAPPNVGPPPLAVAASVLARVESTGAAAVGVDTAGSGAGWS